MSKKQHRHWWIWIIVGFYIWFIFRNSMQVAEASNQASLKVAWWLVNHLERFGIYCNFTVFHHYVRKAAHFTEFAGLGFLVMLALSICPLIINRFFSFSLFLVAVPFADETLQTHINGRNGQVSDMLIDASGFLFGGFLCYLLLLVIKDLVSRHQKRSKASA